MPIVGIYFALKFRKSIISTIAYSSRVEEHGACKNEVRGVFFLTLVEDLCKPYSDFHLNCLDISAT